MYGVTAGAERGCGFRQAGGIYVEVPRGPMGQPVEFFLIDPPQPINPDGLGVSPLGVKILEDPSNPGIFHVFDWVGSQHYENVADFVEEVKRYGLSRRISKSADFGLLGPGSKIVLIHARAYISNSLDYVKAIERLACPKGIHREHFETGMCAGLWWEDVTGGIPAKEVLGKSASGHPRSVIRQMPSFEYAARRRPLSITPSYQPALFAAFPIVNLAVVRDKAGGTHFEALERAQRSGINVTTEDE